MCLASFLQRVKRRKVRRNITMGIDFTYMTFGELKLSVCACACVHASTHEHTCACTHTFVKVYIRF